MLLTVLCFFFFFNDPAPTEIYPLSLHDALPISQMTTRAHVRSSVLARFSTRRLFGLSDDVLLEPIERAGPSAAMIDRKSTRLNSSHSQISYAVFCLKKKKPRSARLYAADLITRTMFPLHHVTHCPMFFFFF